MSSPARSFLAAFNSIEQHLRSTLKARNSDGFSWMVRLANQKRLLTDAHCRDLLQFAELRNAIVHGELFDGQPIAEPHPQIIQRIEAIRDALVSPALAIEILGPKPVEILRPDSSITRALSLIRDTTISQFPVYRGERFVGLLTTNTVARWVANNLDDNGHLDAATVADVITYAEHTESVEFSRGTYQPRMLLLLFFSRGLVNLR